MKIIVTRAFSLAGERQEVGAELEVADAAARELFAMNKAAPAPEREPAPQPDKAAARKRAEKEEASE